MCFAGTDAGIGPCNEMSLCLRFCHRFLKHETFRAGGQSCPPLRIRCGFAALFRVYLKTPNAPGQRAFLRCAASFFLEIRQYSCEKMSCATQKSLAAGHIMSFQIHPRATCQPSRWNAVLSSAISASLMWTMLPRLWESRMELAVSSMTSSRSNACRSELPVTITQSFSTMATG